MIFLSHYTEDKDKLNGLVKALKRRGLKVWFAPEKIGLGASIPREMSRGLESSERLLIAWSRAASLSDHVWNELEAFYMRNPRPGALLFMRMDETPVPTLYAARMYFRWTGTASHDAAVVAKWDSGEPDAKIIRDEDETPDAQLLRRFPRGPLVELHHVTHDLVNAYANLLDKDETATMALMKANRLRLDADPGDPKVTIIGIQYLPTFGHAGPYGFWHAAFQEACKHGPRMLAALLFAQPDDQFPIAARKDRTRLLSHLRTIQSTPELTGRDEPPG
ncbi:MAG TPA: toll/interleukin-1 receptor domain-containing protein [Pyrinomonadaceae bacterium]|jgi:hypothetical protein|nr:toll/interleukin-1 receptor domain-containing protein [Pyrinomonadaceae bacterium]